MVKRGLFVGAIVGVLALMSYGVVDAVAGSGTESHASRERRVVAEGFPPDGSEAPGGRGPGQGQGAGRRAEDTGERGEAAGGWGRLSETGQGAAERQRDPAWAELTGAVVSLEGSELIVQTAQAERVTAGLGKPSYWETLGVTLLPGDAVQLAGFWEGDEFAVSTLTLVATGQTVVLRDDSGRPMWAGGGRWAAPAAVDPGSSF